MTLGYVLERKLKEIAKNMLKKSEITKIRHFLGWGCCNSSISLQKRGFLPSACLALGGCKKYSSGCCHTTCVFVDLLRLISIRESKQCAHTMSRSIFRDPNVRKWRFFRFDTPSEAKIEAVFCDYCDPLLNYWTAWLWRVPEKNVKVKWRNGLHFRPPLRLDLSAGKKIMVISLTVFEI